MHLEVSWQARVPDASNRLFHFCRRPLYSTIRSQYMFKHNLHHQFAQTTPFYIRLLFTGIALAAMASVNWQTSAAVDAIQRPEAIANPQPASGQSLFIQQKHGKHTFHQEAPIARNLVQSGFKQLLSGWVSDLAPVSFAV